MSDNGNDKNLWQWLQNVQGVVLAITALIGALFAFIQVIQGDTDLATAILWFVGISFVWLSCLYFFRFWRPEKQDGSSKLVLPPPTDRQVKKYRQKISQRKLIRRTALVGLLLVPLLAISGYLIQEYRPLQDTLVLVANFEPVDQVDTGITSAIYNPLAVVLDEYDGVKIDRLQAPIVPPTSQKARSVGEAKKASILIWGERFRPDDAVVTANIHFELLSPLGGGSIAGHNIEGDGKASWKRFSG